MKIVAEAFIGHDLVLLGIGSDLVGIHADHGYLDGTGEVEVVVAQVIGARLEVILVKLRRVVGNLEQDWLSCSDACFVRDQVEIKDLVTLIFNERGVYNCAWARIEAFSVGL